MDVIIRKTEGLTGEVSAPSSKAYTHRMLIAACLSVGQSKIVKPLVSDDTQATLRAITAFGAQVKLQENHWTIEGTQSLKTPINPVNCGESASTLRFMIPVAAIAPSFSFFKLGSSLERRPLTPLLQCLQQLGVKSSSHGSLVKVYGGGISGGKVSIRGDVSSQFISGLLFACPKAKKDTEISISPPLESKNYVQMTIEVLIKHGIKIFTSNNLRRFQISSKQQYNACDHIVPGDFSSAAFLLAMAVLTTSKIKVTNLDCNTLQGDKAIVNILKKMGAIIRAGQDYVEVEAAELNSIDIDAKDIPDLVPVCTVLACYSSGTSRIYNAKRLRYKESDRLAALHIELGKMGAEIVLRNDDLIIRGPCKMRGNTINSHNDHRIVMACTIAALAANGQTKIQNAECVSKSYSTFFSDLRSLGAEVIGG